MKETVAFFARIFVRLMQNGHYFHWSLIRLYDLKLVSFKRLLTNNLQFFEPRFTSVNLRFWPQSTSSGPARTKKCSNNHEKNKMFILSVFSWSRLMKMRKCGFSALFFPTIVNVIICGCWTNRSSSSCLQTQLKEAHIPILNPSSCCFSLEDWPQLCGAGGWADRPGAPVGPRWPDYSPPFVLVVWPAGPACLPAAVVTKQTPPLPSPPCSLFTRWFSSRPPLMLLARPSGTKPVSCGW